ncbi:MAG: hypothetical protein B7X44_02510 [Halothiobacillus sp. 15-55-196]|jgi:hypothetical protein|uniref:hypothetical protein n=1 Tax=Halothiobacillus sp. 15-55-196 TaxID=1970382 RepID=UPI000BCB4292|nr:hypothetical protein [Halothiobacillus sp. 15-55-196]OZB37274.1 MAG: hypothetical protein B7X44_02510 [Halothiobacillus sp. 15-55-196]
MTNIIAQTDFNLQVECLFAEHSGCAFAALRFAEPKFSLFVEGETVLAEPKGSPRFPYGTFCELEEALTGNELEAHMWHWLRSGEAYDQFLGMNVCRFGC